MCTHLVLEPVKRFCVNSAAPDTVQAGVWVASCNIGLRSYLELSTILSEFHNDRERPLLYWDLLVVLWAL